MRASVGVSTRLLNWWRSSGVREVRLLALVPLAVSCVMLWPAILGLGVLAPTDIVAYDPMIAGKPPGAPMPTPENLVLGDVVDAFIPWQLYIRSELSAGRFPLWNSDNLLGTYLFANLQSRILSPFNLLWLLLPPLWGFGAVAAVKWTIYGLGMGLLLRRLGLGMAPAIFGSIALQLAAPMLGWLQYPLADVLAVLPWMLWAALGWLDTLRVRWLAALSLLVAASFLGGHAENTFNSMACLAVFALATLVSSPISKWRNGFVGLAGAGLLGIGLAAVQLLPFFAELPSSWQLAIRPDSHVQEISLQPITALLWLTPNGLGWASAYTGPMNWLEENPYVGSITLLLAVWGLASAVFATGVPGRGRLSLQVFSPRKPLFWVLLMVVTGSMVYGVPPFSFLRELPVFNTSFNWRLVVLTGLCVVVLGAMGFERLLTLPARPLPRVWSFVVAAFVIIGVWFLGDGLRIWNVGSADVEAYTHAWRSWAIVLFCAGAAIILSRLLGWVRPGTLALLVISILLLDMVRAGWNFNPTAAFKTFYPTNKLLDFAAQRGPTERMAVAGPYAESNRLLAYGIAEYRYYDPMYDQVFRKFTKLASPHTFVEADPAYHIHLILHKPRAALLSAVGIKWLLSADNDDPNSWQRVPSEGPIYTRTISNNGFSIWEYRYARPYLYLADKVTLQPNSEAVRARMDSFVLADLNDVQVEDPSGTFPKFASLGGIAAGNDRASLTSYVPGEINVRVSVQSDRARFLVVNEGWSQGWRAEIDGLPAAIYRANYVVQGVVVSPGEHLVRFVYDPPAFRWGFIVSGVALVIWIGLLGTAIYEPRKLKNIWRRRTTFSRAV